MKDVFKKYAKEVNKDFKKLNYIYKGKNYTYKKINNEKVNDIATDFDGTEKVMHITVVEFKKKKLEYDDEYECLLIPFDDEALERYQISQKKKFYIKNFIILFIQYLIILLSVIFGFAFKIKEKWVYFFLPTIIKFIPLFIALMIFIISTKDRKSKVKTIIFVIIYPFIMIFSSLLLSEFLESKYIITGISLILIYISSLGIHLLIFKNTRLLFLLISAIVPSFIGFLLFSLLWLKYSLGIFLTFIFWIVTITCYILWAFYSVKTSKLDEYFYTAMIFDYGILLGFPYIIILMIDYMERNITFKIFFILLYQYLVIDLIVWIALPIIKKNNENISFFSLFMILCFFISLLMSFFLLCTLKKGFCKKEGFRKVNLIFYVPIMIIIYIHFSFIIKDDYVLCFILEIFFVTFNYTLYFHLGFRYIYLSFSNNSLLF